MIRVARTELVAILHGIRSVYNVGSMFRTADGAGIGKMFLCGITPTPLDVFGKPRADFAKTALGSELSVPWEKVARAGDCIRRLKADGYSVIAVELASGAVPYSGATCLRDRKIALVFGNEVEGLSKRILEKCDAIVFIPMRGKKESLNVSVAFGIVAYEAAKAIDEKRL